MLGDRPNQVDKQRDDVDVTAEQLLDASSAGDELTEEGLRSRTSTSASSTSRRGCAATAPPAIYGLMEDAATAEISRSQVWQWVRHGVTLDNGKTVTAELVRETATSELEKIRERGRRRVLPRRRAGRTSRGALFERSRWTTRSSSS